MDEPIRIDEEKVPKWKQDQREAEWRTDKYSFYPPMITKEGRLVYQDGVVYEYEVRRNAEKEERKCKYHKHKIKTDHKGNPKPAGKPLRKVGKISKKLLREERLKEEELYGEE